MAEMGLAEDLGRGGWSGTVRVGWGLRKVEEKWGRRVLTVADSMVSSGDGETGREEEEACLCLISSSNVRRFFYIFFLR